MEQTILQKVSEEDFDAVVRLLIPELYQEFHCEDTPPWWTTHWARGQTAFSMDIPFMEGDQRYVLEFKVVTPVDSESHYCWAEWVLFDATNNVLQEISAQVEEGSEPFASPYKATINTTIFFSIERV